MKVTVRYHAILREETGRAEEPFELPSGSGVKDVLAHFFAAYPELGGLEKSLKVAVNDEFAQPGDALKDGDTVDLLPPFGGG